MKRRDLIKLLESNGWWLLRNGSNHDIYTNGQRSEPNHDIYTNGQRSEPIPRHGEIKEQLAKAIIRRQGLK